MWTALVVISLVLIYYYLRKINRYWEERGVYGPEPWILLGNMATALFGKLYFADFYGHFYR